MRLLALLPIVVAAAAGAELPSPAREPALESALRCRLKKAERPREPIRPHKLADMPPADQVLTVLRLTDGCPKPVVVRRDISKK